ncbi:MAG: hypothetical protein H6832_02395 [Planctomycetes bacterium]|nr:hypothetical protein [Planctomycetota bacterium]MCB9917239.1 hypothetical protein [Planctomycetota bacterium]
MTTLESTVLSSQSRAQARVWIRSPRWDLAWLLGSAIIVPLVLALVWGGVSSANLMLIITALIGGPHLFSTYVVTYLDPAFRKAHGRVLLAITCLIPPLVLWGITTNFAVMLTLFIFAASLHVVQQNAYLTDVYRRRAGTPEAPRSRWIDYGLLFVCMHPIASWKLVHDDFRLGEIPIRLPEILNGPWTYWTVWITFAFFLVAWIRKTVREARDGTLNRPKTLLIAVTAIIAFLVPAAADGARLELAFQSVNAWHSFQYLGLVWYVLMVRKQHGLVKSRVVRSIAGAGRSQTLRFYGFCFAITVVLLAALYSIARVDPLGLTFQQYWYVMVLSPLLIHYALDAYLFAVSNKQNVDVDTVPFAISDF